MTEGSSDVVAKELRPKIVIVGVGHVFDIRESVRHVIRQKMPDTVAIELDSARFYGLLSKQKGGKANAPLIYQLLGRFQQNLAAEYGSEAGSEMLAAANAAKEIGAKLALIDMDAMLMFRKLTSAMSMKERLMMATGAIMSLFTRKKTVEKELERFAADEEGFMEQVEKVYPSITRVLIDERNTFMTDRLKELATQSAVTVAVVGDGHVSGMTTLLSGFADLEIIRLSELRQMATHVTLSGDNAQMTMSFTLGTDPPGGKA